MLPQIIKAVILKNKEHIQNIFSVIRKLWYKNCKQDRTKFRSVETSHLIFKNFAEVQI